MALNFWGKQNLLRNAMTAPPKYAYKTSNTVKRFAHLQKTPSKKIQAGMTSLCYIPAHKSNEVLASSVNILGYFIQTFFNNGHNYMNFP